MSLFDEIPKQISSSAISAATGAAVLWIVARYRTVATNRQKLDHLEQSMDAKFKMLNARLDAMERIRSQEMDYFKETLKDTRDTLKSIVERSYK